MSGEVVSIRNKHLTYDMCTLLSANVDDGGHDDEPSEMKKENKNPITTLIHYTTTTKD